MIRRTEIECPKCEGKGHIDVMDGKWLRSRPCNCLAGVLWASQFTEANLLSLLGPADKITHGGKVS